jgi:hypothetical protein
MCSPARLPAGTPSWVDRRDSPNERFNNHNWVEVYDGSGWSFTGARAVLATMMAVDPSVNLQPLTTAII